MKYPYIGEGKNSGLIALFYEQSKFVPIESRIWAVSGLELCDGVDESYFENATANYLRNTKIRIESPEHSEFVQLLAEIADYRRNIGGATAVREFDKAEWIYFDDEFFMSTSQPFQHVEYKEIFLPLPPEREKSTVSGYGKVGEGFVHKQVDSESPVDEWPKVGSSVEWGHTGKGEVKSLSDGFAWIKLDNKDYTTVYVSSLRKPKTPEEELRDEIFDAVSSRIESALELDVMPRQQLSSLITSSLMRDYDITKKPQ